MKSNNRHVHVERDHESLMVMLQDYSKLSIIKEVYVCGTQTQCLSVFWVAILYSKSNTTYDPI